MYRSKLLLAAVLLVGFTITGFECASTEITSAKLYIQQKNYTKALEALQKEVQKNPKSDEGYYLLGYVDGELGNYKDMVDAYDKSLGISNQFAKNINDAKIHYWAQLFNQGVGYFQKGSNTKDKDSTRVYYDKSINAFKQAVYIEPDSIETNKNLAFVYMSEQKYDDAIEPLQKIIDKGNSEDGYKYLGEIYYDKATKLDAKYKSTKNVEDSTQAMEYYNKNIALLKKARKLYPSNSEILLLLSNSYIGAHEITVAMDAFKAGVQQEPNNKYYRYNYGVLLLGNKDYKDAEEQFLKAIDIDPDYQNAIYNMAVTYVRWGAELNKEAIDSGDTTSAHSEVYMEKYRKALPYLEKVVKMKGDDANMWELLGRVYTILGHQEKAKEAYSKADQLRK